MVDVADRLLEGGFDNEGAFFYIPFSGLDAMVEVFRRRVVWLLVEKELLDELTQHIPPKGTQLMRRYGLYSSRIKGRWEEMDYVADRAPQGWRTEHERSADSDQTALGFTPLADSQEIDSTARKSAWARLPARVYEVDPLICTKCGSPYEVQFRVCEAAGRSTSALAATSALVLFANPRQ